MKVLITSDIHINDFRSFNIKGDSLFRLHQFDSLAQRLVQIVKHEEVSAMCIAGDFLHVASPRPYIVNAAGRFLKTVAKHVPIFITHGQHDYDSRTIMSEENSLLSLYNNIDNVRYLDKTGVWIGDKHFYFQGWTPDQDFSHVPHGTYDILIGHATINSARMNDYGAEASGPVFDNDKFRLCFMGDIHYPQTKNNQVIPGVPIQNNFGDSSDNSVIILDTNTLSWKRVKTETNEFRFLKFITSDTPSNDPFVITKPKNSFKTKVQKDDLTKSVDISEVINNFVTKENLIKIHEMCLSKISKIEEDEVDLNYSIEKLEIRNFRSIEYLDWSPIEGVTLILGSNGTGKSSLVDGIRFALLGSNTVRDFVRLGQSEMQVSISLIYSGINYQIIRGFNKKSGYTRLIVSGREIEFENKRAADDRVKNDLPFLNLYYSLHRDQDTPRFLGSQSYSERVALMSKVIGLSIVDKLKRVAELDKSPMTKAFEKINDERKNISHFLSSLSSISLDADDTDYAYLIDKAEATLTKTMMLDDIQKKIASDNSEADRITYGISQFSSYDFSELDHGAATDILEVEENVSQLRVMLEICERRISQLMRDKDQIILEISKTQEKLRQAQDKKNKIITSTCFTCSQPINETLTRKLETAIEIEVVNLKSVLDSLQTKIAPIDSSLDDHRLKKDQISKEFISANAESKLLMERQRRFMDLRSAKQRLTSLQDRAEVVEKSISDNTSKWTNYCNLINKKFGLNITNKDELLEAITDLKTQISNYRTKQASQTSISGLREKIKAQKARFDDVNAQCIVLQTDIEDLEKYIEMMSSTGSVVRSVLTTVSENLSDDTIKVIAYKTLTNGETRPDFNLYLKVAGEYINYEMLSGGQKNVCDIFILKHLIDLAGGAGSLIFDETFSQVDSANLEYTVDILKNMKVNNILIISHHENFPYYDSIISTNFDPSTGITTYNLPK